MFSTILNIKRGRFVRNVAAVAGGAVGAQAITIAASPLVTRLYGPEAFGLAGTFIALVSIITPVAAMAYPMAIVLPKKEASARELMLLSLCIGVAGSILALLFVSFFGPTFLDGIGLKALEPFRYLFPVVILFIAWAQICQYFLVRHNAFSITARITVLQALIVSVAKVLLGFIYPFGSVLIGLQIAANFLSATLFTIAALAIKRKIDGNTATKKPQKKDLLHSLTWQAAEYKDFPYYRAPQNFINSVSQNAPVILLAGLFSPAAAGYYALARTALGLPSALIAQSVGTVFYSRIAEANNSGEGKFPLILKATLGLAAIGAVPYAAVFLFGPCLFGIAFGAEWERAGVYSSWLSLMYYFNFINRPCVSAIPVLNIQKGLLIYEILSTGSKFLALFVGFSLYKDDVVAIALFSAAGVIAYASLITWVLISSKYRDRSSICVENR